MIILMAFLTAFAVDNAEFTATVKQQQSEGYKWTYVGKSTPSGTPAITVDTVNGSHIYYRLTK